MYGYRKTPGFNERAGAKMEMVGNLTGSPMLNINDFGRMREEMLRKVAKVIGRICTCGGRGPTDTEACPACIVWHEIRMELTR